MKNILVIGIGAGNPEHLTVQAIKALNRADVIFLLDKGAAKQQLSQVRQQICEQYITQRPYRLVEAPSPERERDGLDYLTAVDRLNLDKQRVFARLIAEELEDGQCGAFLVWGDPSLYDSTLRILDAILHTGQCLFEYEVIPGITSVQALTASHKVPLNSIGGAVTLTPARRLAESLPANADSVVVMLDAEDSYRQLLGQNLHIYWGAYVGTADEILISGKLDDVADQITQVRKAARQAHGWVMDTYLLKRL